jgi:hypothetical protein
MIDASLLENPNLAMLEIAVQALGELCESLVFVGGVPGFLVTTGLSPWPPLPTAPAAGWN